MDAERMDLLERLARLRALGAITRREFAREKQAILRGPARSTPPQLRTLPGAGTAAPSAVPMSFATFSAAARPGRVPIEPEPTTLLQRLGRIAGWILWMLFSIGGLDALLDRDPLQALALLVAGLLFAPPLHRLLATRLALPTRLAVTLLGVIAALGIGSAPSLGAEPPAPAISPGAAAACGEVVSEVARARGERARAGIVHPWRKLWTDLAWARVAGRSAYQEWRARRGGQGRS